MGGDSRKGRLNVAGSDEGFGTAAEDFDGTHETITMELLLDHEINVRALAVHGQKVDEVLENFQRRFRILDGSEIQMETVVLNFTAGVASLNVARKKYRIFSDQMWMPLQKFAGLTTRQYIKGIMILELRDHSKILTNHTSGRPIPTAVDQEKLEPGWFMHGGRA